MLTAELERYARQIVLPEIGLAGQERLGRARVLIVGAGGLGSPVALYLAAAGVGTLGIVDSDDVELSNLHRQILHGSGDVGGAKVSSARETLERLNPTVNVLPMRERLDAPRARAIVADWHVVVDGSDNYSTRYAVNDACAAAGKTWIYGSVERFSGQLSVFDAATGPCYRCVYPIPPSPGTTASCEEIGVLGAVPGVIGSLQALEALKLILDVGEPMRGRLLQIDFLNGQWRTIGFDKRANCPACGAAGETGGQMSSASDVPDDIEPIELMSLLRAGGDVAPRLIDVREPWEWNITRLDGAQLIPLDRITQDARTLERDRVMVVYCHHGTRSAAAAEWLRAHGFRARNLTGGIDRWSREIDDKIRRY